MQITLYKNCPISNDYNVVWNNSCKEQTAYSGLPTTAHTTLLNNLESVTFDIDYVYLDDSGEIILDIEDEDNAIWFIDYNYMSYELQTNSGNSHINVYGYNNTNSVKLNYKYKSNNTIWTSLYQASNYMVFGCNYLQRYAFVKSIEYFNDCIKIKYESDIWSTYSPFIDFGIGTITRFSDLCLYKSGSSTITSVAQEKDYFSNSALLKYNLSGDTISTSLTGNQDCYCLATIQYYNLDSSGNQTSRVLDSVLLARGSSEDVSGFNETSFVHSVDEWNEYIVELMTYQSTQQTITEHYYEIQDIYFIPVNLNNNDDSDYLISQWITNLFDSTNTSLLWAYSLSNYIEYTDNNTTIYYYLMSLSKYFDDNSYPSYKPVLTHTFTLTSGTITNDFKRAGIGFYTHMIPIECNNPLTQLTYKITMSFDCCNINFYLELNNKIIEITDDLLVKIPIQIATADVTQLQAITRAINNKRNITGGVLGTASSVLGSISGFAQGNILGGVNSLISGASNVINAVFDNKLINAEAYTSNKSIDANSVGYLNAYYGLIDFYIDSINDNEVDAINLKKGYIYNEPNTIESNDFIDFYPNGAIMELCDNVSSNIGDKIRFIQMQNVYIKGNFSQDIRNKLIQIINNGFRLITSAHATNYESYL